MEENIRISYKWQKKITKCSIEFKDIKFISKNNKFTPNDAV